MAAITTLLATNVAAAAVNFVPLVGSAGDGIPAKWNATSTGNTLKDRSSFDMLTRPNDKKDARKVIETFKTHRKDAVSGLVVDSAVTVISHTVPDTWTDAQVLDHFEIQRTLLGTTGVRDIRASRYAPT